MRVFLVAYLFYMVFSCVFTSVASVLDWSEHYGIETSPLPLPTDAELARIRAQTDRGLYASESERYRASLYSLAQFFVPGWSSTPLRNMSSISDYLSAPLVWIESRMFFVGEAIGVTQKWIMFSPNFPTEYALPRYTLFFEDGTQTVIRAECDPPADLLEPVYPFWFNEKRLRACYGFLSYESIRVGYFNYLRHAHPTSPSGSPLAEIHAHRVVYKFLPIGADAVTWYTEQSGPPASQITGPVWVFDARSGDISSGQESL